MLEESTKVALTKLRRRPVEKQVSSKLTMTTGIPRRSASAGNSLAGRTILPSPMCSQHVRFK